MLSQDIASSRPNLAQLIERRWLLQWPRTALKLPAANKTHIERAANYALQAYKGIPNSIRIESWWTSTTAYVVIGENVNYVVFRGTQQVQDWFFNASALPYRYNRRWAHAGFVIAHKSVWKRIRRLLDPYKRTVFCGHSLGAALAELSAHCAQDFTDLSLVCFGKPNVFVAGSKQRMNHLQQQISFVCGSDVVTRIPKMCYRPDDNQTMVYFDNDGRTIINPERDYVKEDWGLGDSVSDHSMDNYRDLVVNDFLRIDELRG
jgi:hypothetical protein